MNAPPPPVPEMDRSTDDVVTRWETRSHDGSMPGGGDSRCSCLRCKPFIQTHTEGGAKTTGGQSNLTTGCIAATHGRLNGTCQVALACTPPNICFFGPNRVLNPNSIWIGSAVFAGLTIVTDWQTDRLHYLVLQCSLKTSHWPLLVRHTPHISPGSVAT